MMQQIQLSGSLALGTLLLAKYVIAHGFVSGLMADNVL